MDEPATLFPGSVIRFEGGPYAHRFGGRQSIPGADCPNCKKPLMQHLVLDTRDPLVPLRSVAPLIPLLYCMRCALCWETFSYSFEKLDRIRILQAHRGETCWDDWYGEGMGDEFEERAVMLEPISPRIQELLDFMTREDQALPAEEEAEVRQCLKWPQGRAVDAFNQVGGRTFMICGPLTQFCSKCAKQPMGLLASLANSVITRQSYVQLMPKGAHWQILFFMCPRCASISVINRG